MSQPYPGRSLGLDIGDVRIGVALSDPLGIIASPHDVIRCTSPQKDAAAIAKLVEEKEVVRVVAGLPLDQRGECGPQARKVLAFLDELRPLIKAEIVTQDERFTTAAAERMLIDADVSRKGRKKVIDKVAAQYILQTYLDRQARDRSAS
ncbi:MAG: Holliday junction resolvase RuvX [Candidatus Hydrogenedentes bacterium]|nr:Holliday junction resolvase RuvX [Candidatus Hydrogenedentota bacterium]